MSEQESKFPEGSTRIIAGAESFKDPGGKLPRSNPAPARWWHLPIILALVFGPGMMAAAYSWIAGDPASVTVFAFFIVTVGWIINGGILFGMAGGRA